MNQMKIENWKSLCFKKHWCPEAGIYPMLAEEELDSLAKDIKVNGLMNPIVLFEGKVLDGRNRLMACKKAGVEPHFIKYRAKGSVISWVISQNSHRRHLTKGQKACAAAMALPMIEKEARARSRSNLKNSTLDTAKMPSRTEGESRQIVGDRMGVSPRYVSRARRIQKEAPSVFEELRSGIINIPQAENRVHELQRVEEQQKSKKRFKASSDLYQLHCGDFTKLGEKIEDASIDYIVTDPPYDEGFLPQLENLGELAQRVLRDGGGLLMTPGNMFMDQIHGVLSKYLTYHWTLAILTPHPQIRINSRRLNQGYSPMIWYRKGKARSRFLSTDVFTSQRKEQRDHKWGKNLNVIKEIIDGISVEGELILDPMMGGGTTGVASIEKKRRFIGIEIDKVSFNTCKKRIGEASN
jgi:DNA modification methylase